MLTREQIQADLDKLVEQLRSPSGLLGSLIRAQPRSDMLLTECAKLYRQVSALPQGADTWDDSLQLFKLERRVSAFRALRILGPAVLAIYLPLIALFFGLRYLNLPTLLQTFTKDVLKVDAPGRLITFGIAGALVYLATSVLAYLHRPERQNDPIRAIGDFSIRLLLAIVVPIILVSLFFTDSVATSDAPMAAKLRLSPELLAFICGYSAKLVVDVLNKLVEKGGKMIDAI